MSFCSIREKEGEDTPGYTVVWEGFVAMDKNHLSLLLHKVYQNSQGDFVSYSNYFAVMVKQTHQWLKIGIEPVQCLGWVTQPVEGKNTWFYRKSDISCFLSHEGCEQT